MSSNSIYNSTNKERILSDFIGLNPTGTLTFEGTFSMNGPNTQIVSPEKMAKENLKKTQENQFICEGFENMEIPRKNGLSKESRFLFILLLIYFLILFVSLIHHFK